MIEVEALDKVWCLGRMNFREDSGFVTEETAKHPAFLFLLSREDSHRLHAPAGLDGHCRSVKLQDQRVSLHGVHRQETSYPLHLPGVAQCRKPKVATDLQSSPQPD